MQPLKWLYKLKRTDGMFSPSVAKTLHYFLHLILYGLAGILKGVDIDV